MATPYATVHLASTPTTQDEARRRFNESPVLVVADTQTQGRGRMGRSWRSAPRALATSLACRPSWPRDTWGRLTLVAGLAARTALGDVALDWPNDLVVGKDKVGGLLAEAADDVVVFGLGANLWWPDAPDGVAALESADPGPEAAPRLAAAFADDLLMRLEGTAEEWGRAEYLAHCVTIGAAVSWEGGSGTAANIADDGSIEIDTGSELVVVASNEVRRLSRTTVPPMGNDL